MVIRCEIGRLTQRVKGSYRSDGRAVHIIFSRYVWFNCFHANIVFKECATQTREVPEEQCATTVEQECTNTVKQVIILGNMKYEQRE